MIWVGIDPGLSGAISALDAGGHFVSIADTPTQSIKKNNGGNKRIYIEGEMVSILQGLQQKGIVRVAIENVHAMPKQGVTSMFSMGTGFGLWLGMLAALQIPYEKIEPKMWKKIMGIPGGSDKSAGLIICRRLYPKAPLSLAKHDGRADAIMLAEALRRKIQKQELINE